jgi:hypothetical protein
VVNLHLLSCCADLTAQALVCSCVRHMFANMLCDFDLMQVSPLQPDSAPDGAAEPHHPTPVEWGYARLSADVWKELQPFLRQEAERMFPQDELGVFAEFDLCPWGSDKVLAAAVKKFHSAFHGPYYDHTRRRASYFLKWYRKLHSYIYAFTYLLRGRPLLSPVKY